MKQKRILVVADDAMLLSTLRHWFNGDGHVIDVARESEVAAEKCEEGRYDAVIVDFDMDLLTAYETVLFLRAMGHEAPTLALISCPEERINALICGASVVLEKPLTRDDLEACLKDSVSRLPGRPVFQVQSGSPVGGNDGSDTEDTDEEMLRTSGEWI